jgi:hypothetical protein
LPFRIDPAYLAFVVIPVMLVALFAWACASAGPPRQRTRIARLAVLAGAAWMAITWRVAESGVLRNWNAVPPPFFLLVVAIVALASALAFSPLGRRLAFSIPLWLLVLVQSFRLPLELAMHRLTTLGIMPEQMTFTGRNFDIVTGTTALIVAGLLRAARGGRTLALAWNTVGFLLLTNVVIVAILSTPRFQVFGASRVNVFVTYTPFVWLPAVMVLAALAGHLLIFRRLLTRAPLNQPV